MEDERKGKPAAMIGGMYAKAKQRVLNKIGRRTTLTRNPRVDFISGRVESIKTKKANVSSLASTAKTQLDTVRKTLLELDMAMVEAFNDELGERKWDDDKATYTRMLNPEERRLIADMQRVYARCRTTLDRVVDTYLQHLDETVAKPLTFNTPDEAARLDTVMATKDEYKAVRTLYSDAMIDADADLATGSAPSSGTRGVLEDAKREYEVMSERLCEDALRYERIYRDELAQRVSMHFVAETHLLRGVATAMREFAPYTKGLTLDSEQMRATRRSNLSAAKSGRRGGDGDGDDDDDDDYEVGGGGLDGLEGGPVVGGRRGSDVAAGGVGAQGDGNPFAGFASDVQKRSSEAAAALSEAGKSASKSLSSMMASAGSKGAAKAATKSVTSSFK